MIGAIRPGRLFATQRSCYETFMLHNAPVALIGRDEDLRRVGERLFTGSLLLVGPRRIGKTELLRHVVEQPPTGITAMRVDLEGLNDVAGAVARIRDACGRRELAPRRVLDKLRELKRVEVAGVLEVERGDSPHTSSWNALEELLEAAVGNLKKDGVLCLMLDEVPWWLDGLRGRIEGDADREAGLARVRQALAQLRFLRQREGLADRLRMVFTGSVGLATLAAAAGAPAELNDLEVHELGPLADEAGTALFEAELLARGIGCTPTAALEAHRLAGGSPHWIKQVAAKVTRRKQADGAAVGDAVERLLGARMRHLFEDEGSAHLARRHGDRAPALKAILSAASAADAGVARTVAVAAALAAGIPSRAGAEQAVLQLVDEFYLEVSGDRVRFGNPLFRRWWTRYGGGS
jgi:hypothetical protein